jgi:hypothetical protein
MARWARRPTRSYGLGSYTLISLSRQGDGSLLSDHYADGQANFHFVDEAVAALMAGDTVINVPNDSSFCDAVRANLAKQEAQHATA